MGTGPKKNAVLGVVGLVARLAGLTVPLTCGARGFRWPSGGSGGQGLYNGFSL